MGNTPRPQFPLGRLVATPAALEALAQSGDSAHEFIRRHATGDWGDIGAEDKRANDAALTNGERLLSAYHLRDGTAVWLLTEADRLVTTLLLPSDY